MNLRRVIRGTGKTLISIGVLLFLFVAYQLWGTGLTERREQKELKDQFRQAVAQPAPEAAASTPRPPPVPGDAVALIEIDRIGLEKAVVEGVGVEDLKKGPGHYPGTPLPGEKGNAAIAGHRTTYGAPFFRLDELEANDLIKVTTTRGQFEYRVERSQIVGPGDDFVLDTTEGENQLTLTTCHPRYSAAQRLIVFANLIGTVLEAPPQAAPAPAPVSLNTDRAGLSGEDAARGPAVMWGSLAAFIWLLAWLVGQAWRRWPAYLIATPVFLVVLFLFYENVARLLPANV